MESCIGLNNVRHYLDPVTRVFAQVGREPTRPKIYEMGFQGAREFLEGAQTHTPATDVLSEESGIQG
jgi:hypothetical protein